MPWPARPSARYGGNFLGASAYHAGDEGIFGGKADAVISRRQRSIDVAEMPPLSAVSDMRVHQ